MSLARSTSTATNSAKHYAAHTASSYESAYFYSPGEYTSYLSNIVRKTLGIQPPSDDDGDRRQRHRRRLLDIGGGTGNFTKMLIDDIPDTDAVIVDPFLTNEDGTEVTVGTKTKNRIFFVNANAEAFSVPKNSSPSKEVPSPWWKENYHQCLMKEVVHHIDESSREDIFRGLHRGLLGFTPETTIPSLLIITRPQHDIDYPLWPKARQIWAENQPPLEDIQTDLERAGFRNVGHSIQPYRCETELDRWLSMVKNRFWSTFSNFTDEELEDGCRVIKSNVDVDDEGKIQFEDRLLFITACK